MGVDLQNGLCPRWRGVDTLSAYCQKRLTKMTYADPFMVGYDAFLNGGDYENNPYLEGYDDSAVKWEHGWSTAKEECGEPLEVG